MTTKEKEQKQIALDSLRAEFEAMKKAKQNGEYYNNEPVSPHRIDQLRREIWALEDEVQQGVSDPPEIKEENLNPDIKNDIEAVKNAENITREANGVQTEAIETREGSEEISKLQSEKTELLKEVSRLATENEQLTTKLAEIVKGYEELQKLAVKVEKELSKTPAKKAAKKKK